MTLPQLLIVLAFAPIVLALLIDNDQERAPSRFELDTLHNGKGAA